MSFPRHKPRYKFYVDPLNAIAPYKNCHNTPRASGGLIPHARERETEIKFDFFKSYFEIFFLKLIE